MKILPWLLHWPPRPTTVAVVILVTVASVAGLYVFAGGDSISYDEASIDAADVAVILNDEHTYPDEANGSVHTCFGSGPPGDGISVRGTIDLTIPATEDALLLSVSLAHTSEEWTQRLSRAGEISVNVLWVIEDDEQLDVGDTATVEVRLRDEATTVKNRTEDVVVENGSRTYDC